MTRCVSCVEKKLRRMVAQLTKKNREAEAKIVELEKELKELKEVGDG